MNPVMHTSTTMIGLGSIIYTLRKLDSHLHWGEPTSASERLANWPTSDLTICAMVIRDNVDHDGATEPGLLSDKRTECTKETMKRFVTLLVRVAQAQDGISRKEQAFIRQFWHETQRLSGRGFSQPGTSANPGLLR